MKDTLTTIALFGLMFGVATSAFIGASFWGITFPLAAALIYVSTYLS